MVFESHMSQLSRMLRMVDEDPDMLDEYSSQPLVEQWGDDINELLHMLPDSLVEDWQMLRELTRYTVTNVYADKEIHGTVQEYGNGSGNVFVRFKDSKIVGPQFGCTLCEISGDNLCHHSIGFVDYLDDQLDGRRSKLRTQIEKAKFTKGNPDRSLFQIDYSKRVFRDINNLISVLPKTATVDQLDESLPPIAETAKQRICWAISCDAEGLSVEGMLQQQKKRGTGFTKGRKIRLEKLVTDRTLPFSEVDQKVVEQIELIQDYYRHGGTYHLSPLAAIAELVGQDNVTFNDSQCTIASRTPVITIGQKDENLMAFTLARSADESDGQQTQRVFFDDTQMAVIDQDRHHIWFSCPGENAISAIRSLISAAPFANDQLPEVAKQLEVLRPFVSIQLPQSIGGPLVAETAKPVVILRSRSDGQLDYGVRVRTESGKLKRPGSPPLVQIEKDANGKPVQRIRSGENETKAASDLIAELGLVADNQTFHGTIDDFQVALRVIERLQSEELDIEVLWDKTSEKPVKVLGNLSSKNVRVDIASKRNWFGVTGECKFGNQSMPLADLLRNLPAADQAIGDFINLGDGGWAKINDKLRDRLKQLRDATHSDRKTLKLDATSAPAIRDLMDEDIEIKATKAWEKCLKRLADAEKLQPVVPKNLDANLRDYQVDGYKWMSRLAAWGVGGILADDMGLGKTLQTLAVLLDRAADGPALVIAPTSVGFNWARESERFAPDLDVHLYRETDRADFLASVGPGTLVVCSYGLALRDAEALAAVSWNTLVLDEAQAIKNSRSKTSRAIASIEADWTVALTGTPVENHLGELWSLFQIVSPGVFGGWEQFRSRYAGPIEKQNDDEARQSLATRIQPFVLRRTKTEVLKELPPRTEMNLYVDLSAAERAEYEQVRLAAIGEIEQLESMPDIQDQRFKILALMTRLRQISCHPGLVNKNWQESSAKLDQLCSTLADLKEEGHRALVFSQFTSHLALIRDALDQRGFTYEYLDGSTPAKSRQTAVDQFQNGSADLFLISLKAGGTGLNLTAADYVIHMDPWWNPAVEDQATDRAHRFGQDKPVMVYRIVARGTIEEEILALHESKRDLVAGVMQGTQAAAKLSNEDLIRMMRG
ncbi:RNA polymerase-associated protein RapA [Rubripirellula obstinata]|uniref:RNA polymerase-associated protein RapA n=1 Tax=Rubripirellula obstinata TaxID=406547 RepID=A0A5B1CKS9_9BACT|nr:DEAD/DEAH box helicase [Rubripirellula obstinata]KAA1260485.1 RNA polymerase-associated protein RapA [Rubripirellula obstinata]